MAQQEPTGPPVCMSVDRYVSWRACINACMHVCMYVRTHARKQYVLCWSRRAQCSLSLPLEGEGGPYREAGAKR